MTVSFGSAVKGQSQAHTGVQVPIAAEGPSAAAVADLNEQTDLFDLISRLLKLKD
jgi:alkaline phosphatase